MATVGEVEAYSTKAGEFEWKIPESYIFSETNEYECYTSPSFSFAGEIWCMQICPNGWVKDNSVGYIDLELVKMSSGPPVEMKASFMLKTLDGKNGFKRNCKYVFKHTWETIECKRFLTRTELLKRKLELFPSNVLTVLCSLETFGEDASGCTTIECSYCGEFIAGERILLHEKKCMDKPIKCPECSYIVLLQDWYEHECQKESSGEVCTSGFSIVLYENKVLHDLKEFFFRKEDCDVILKVKGQEFPAHKAILQARSSVFQSTFRYDMKEKASGIVEIEDCDPSCFSDFLCFLYCGDAKGISKENVFSLFTVADKYDVQDLRTNCVEFMKENLSVDTFCDTITLALKHSETALTESTIDFFTKNVSKIILTVKWQLFLAEYPTQSNELLIKLLAPGQNIRK